MKFTVTFKDPDAVSDAIRNAAVNSVAVMPDLSEAERDALVEMRIQTIGEITKRWFKWGEYLTVEVDTEAGSCGVVPG